ncbi:TetR/AcrR family transcriptional regulator [Staphylococcus kloosii]|jgi:AcrR family transcriptional regulator|uniref:TetR/AcrR family transcriptional regulator n=1 Tax=Staphylococcus kloosii TaxID=29384 RepID=UPI00189F9DDB|nr:TetR/AcrR family transcriptional regulator [Staphylococcus kloosii]MBF7025342.1 TetR/AcrR family transcriptional regulator [Staphylococcus kloosii]
MDRRVKRTITSIEYGFIKLLKTYNLEEITIQQIADEADINRATFYKYYMDKYDLLSQLEDKEIERMKANIDYAKLANQKINEVSDLNKIINNVPNSIIKIVLNNIELYEVLFNLKRQSKLEEKLSDTITQNLLTVLNNTTTINNIPFRYFHSYVSGAIISTLKCWVLDSERIPEEEIMKHLYTLMRTGPLEQLVAEVSKKS